MHCIIVRPSYDPWTTFTLTCADEIKEALDEKQLRHADMVDKRATKENVLTIITHFRNSGKNFCFMGFGHGSEDCFHGDNNCIIINTEDKIVFPGNFFYFHSCHNGEKLAQEIVNSGGAGVLGYREKVWLEYHNPLAFKRAANKGIIEMINSNCTLKEAYDMTLAAYEEEIEKTTKKRLFFTSTFLKMNKDALVWSGNGNFKLSNLSV